MSLKTKNFLRFDELTTEEIDNLISLALELKGDLKNGVSKPLLKGKTLAMIFQKPSTRTRVSFEVGMHQMGGSAIVLAPNDMQLSRGETIEDTARTLSRYVDFIMARVFEHSNVEEIGAAASVPVINGLSNSFHPCQTIADLMTIRERRGYMAGLKVVWIGDGNNVCNSLILGCARTGMSITVATPKEFRPNPQIVQEAAKDTDVRLVTDPAEAAGGADIIMTDTFASIHDDPARVDKFLPKFQVNQELMDMAESDAIFMHCLPAKRGQEVTAQVIDGPQSAVWDQAENRLHAQKALLLLLAGHTT